MLKISNLSFRYPDKSWLIRNFTGDYKKGDIIGVKGPSGSGKTTVLNLICGVIPRIFKGDKEGKISYQDIDLSSYRLQEIAPYISMLMQQPDYQLFFPVVEQELAFAPENLKEKPEVIEKKITNALNLLAIPQLRNVESHKLSFGQKKLVALASILTLDPSIYLLDEPTAGLSDFYINILADLIKQLAHEGKIIFIADHNSHLLNLASKEIIMGG